MQEAVAAGYIMSDAKWERGYVSRKSDIAKATVQVAGGSRKGELFVIMPSWDSTQYCVRQYLTKGTVTI